MLKNIQIQMHNCFSFLEILGFCSNCERKTAQKNCISVESGRNMKIFRNLPLYRIWYIDQEVARMAAEMDGLILEMAIMMASEDQGVDAAQQLRALSMTARSRLHHPLSPVLASFVI